MAEKYGVEQIKSLTTSVAKTATAAYGVYKDKKITVTDIRYLPSLLSGLKGVGAVDFKKLLPEADDLSEAESADLAAHFKKEFNLEGESAEAVVEQGFEYLLLAVRALMSFIEVGEKLDK